MHGLTAIRNLVRARIAEVVVSSLISLTAFTMFGAGIVSRD
jgi:hypothetical protein